MTLKDLLEARRNENYICIEDPINGSKFIPQNKRIMNSYIITENNDVQKFKKYHLTCINENIYRVNFEENESYVDIDTKTEIVVLRRVYIIPDNIRNVMVDKFKIIGEERLSMCDIYTLNKVRIDKLTQRLISNKYPYYFSETCYIDGSYRSVLKVMYNSDVIIPRIACIYNNDTFLKAELSSLNFANQCLDSTNMRYIMQGHYLRMKDAVLQFMDINNGGYIFKDLIRNRYKTFPISYNNLQNILDNNKCTDKNCLYFTTSKRNYPLFLYSFADDEHKKEYDKKELLKIYEELLQSSGKEDSAICIIDEDVDAVYESKQIFM